VVSGGHTRRSRTNSSAPAASRATMASRTAAVGRGAGGGVEATGRMGPGTEHTPGGVDAVESDPKVKINKKMRYSNNTYRRIRKKKIENQSSRDGDDLTEHAGGPPPASLAGERLLKSVREMYPRRGPSHEGGYVFSKGGNQRTELMITK